MLSLGTFAQHPLSKLTSQPATYGNHRLTETPGLKHSQETQRAPRSGPTPKAATWVKRTHKQMKQADKVVDQCRWGPYSQCGMSISPRLHLFPWGFGFPQTRWGSQEQNTRGVLSQSPVRCFAKVKLEGQSLVHMPTAEAELQREVTVQSQGRCGKGAE